MARNAAIDLLRELGRGRARQGSPLPGSDGDGRDIDALPSPYPRPEDCALGAEEEAFVAGFLASLGDSDRELLHLAFAEDLPYPEIAALLGRPLGTVKWKISLLKKRLAERWGREFG